jgi:hypothetical protein
VADHLGAWLDNPENRIPLRASDQFAVHLKSRRGGSWSGEDVNRDLLARMIGVRSGTLREQVDSIVDAAVSRGQTVIGGLCQISSIRWADGSERPWIDGIDQRCSSRSPTSVGCAAPSSSTCSQECGIRKCSH